MTCQLKNVLEEFWGVGVSLQAEHLPYGENKSEIVCKYSILLVYRGKRDTS